MTIITGDCLDVMKTFPDNHFSCVVTDPPYGLSFMGKGWDHAVPDVHYWKEAFRICKPGSFLIAMGGTRTFHRLTCAIEDAGFEIRDCISWLYGSGFPKSHNHFGFEGYGTALKPAWEPCILGMKPCEGTFKQNAEKWGQAGINIDGCRVGEEILPAQTRGISRIGTFEDADGNVTAERKGRWPANVILDEEAGAMLDEQSGSLSGAGNKTGSLRKQNKLGFVTSPDRINFKYDNGGGASRFFYCSKASSSERNEGLEGLPDIQCQTGCAGAMPVDDVGKERDRFRKISKNHHPTVKPLKLMEYLIKLVMPPKDGLLLDPFAGSGTTILAAKRLGFDAIGIEKSEEYSAIARKRIESHRDLFVG